MALLITLPVLCISESCIETKNFIFTPLCGASKGFMKGWKVFKKPFEAPQRSGKIKTSIKFFFLSGIKSLRDKISQCIKWEINIWVGILPPTDLFLLRSWINFLTSLETGWNEKLRTLSCFILFNVLHIVWWCYRFYQHRQSEKVYHYPSDQNQSCQQWIQNDQ